MNHDSQYRPADWRPLELALEAEFGKDCTDAASAFWFVGFANGPDDVGELRLYEHSNSHRLLALDRNGLPYRWNDPERLYLRICDEDVLLKVLS